MRLPEVGVHDLLVRPHLVRGADDEDTALVHDDDAVRRAHHEVGAEYCRL